MGSDSGTLPGCWQEMDERDQSPQRRHAGGCQIDHNSGRSSMLLPFGQTMGVQLLAAHPFFSGRRHDYKICGQRDDVTHCFQCPFNGF
jgi:hypothetical protein